MQQQPSANRSCLLNQELLVYLLKCFLNAGVVETQLLRRSTSLHKPLLFLFFELVRSDVRARLRKRLQASPLLRWWGLSCLQLYLGAALFVSPLRPAGVNAAKAGCIWVENKKKQTRTGTWLTLDLTPDLCCRLTLLLCASMFYLQSAEDAGVLHALVRGQLAEAPAEDVEMPQDLRGRTKHEGACARLQHG